MRPIRTVLTAALLASLAGSLAPAAHAALAPDALVQGAAGVAARASFDKPSQRVALHIATARAHLRRKNPAAALAALDLAAPSAARISPAAEGPLARPLALAELGAAFHAAGRADRGRIAFADAQGVVPAPPADPFKLAFLEVLAKGGLTKEAEAVGAGMGAPLARARMAQAARLGGDNKLAAQRAGEALAIWRKAPGSEPLSNQVALAIAFWRAGYPAEAIEIAGKLPKAAWPYEVRPFVEAINGEPPADKTPGHAAFRKWIEIAIGNCDTNRWQDEHAEAELLAELGNAFDAIKVEDRAYYTLLAADDRLVLAMNRAAGDSDSPAFLAGRAAALVTIGDAYLRVGKGKEGTDRFARGERLAAGITEPGAWRDLALRTQVDAAVARARAGVPEEAVKSAGKIGHPYYRGLALLKIDELAPETPTMLTEEGEAALAEASK